MEQELRFCTTPDGARLAYATAGSGPPLVIVPGWVSHLELSWTSLREAVGPLAGRRRLIPYTTLCPSLKQRHLQHEPPESRTRHFEPLENNHELHHFNNYPTTAEKLIAMIY